MAIIDKYIELLIKNKGQSLIFKSDATVECIVAGKSNKIGNAPLDTKKILSVLKEVIPENQLMAAEGSSIDHPYKSPSGTVKMSVSIVAGEAMVKVVPSTEKTLSAEGATTASAPISTYKPEPGSPEIDAMFHAMIELEASNLHLKSNQKPMVRIHGEMQFLPGFDAMSSDELMELIKPTMPEKNITQFAEIWDTDYAYAPKGRSRIRCNVFKDMLGDGAVFKQIASKIFSVKELNLPPVTLDLCANPKGLILVTGSTGSGKSTTLATMIDYLNETRSDHIITIEDPVEFIHEDKKCLVSQREVGTHTKSFKSALRAALREDPDIVLVGELRDLETTQIAIETAVTGHLVLATLHTNTASTSIDRLIDQFPADRQGQIRSMLSESLLGVISQTLCKKKTGGRIAAREVLVITSAVSNLIRDGKTFQIPSIMQTSRNLGMQLLSEVLVDYVKKKIIEPEEAYMRAFEKREISLALTRAGFRGKWSEEHQ
ncbi:MAG: PilT/PilU family type 4a pilus ATPase [Thermodesulfobacteriota bacterium]